MQIKDEIQDRPKKARKDRVKVPKKITQSYLFNSGTYYLQRFTASSAHFKTVMMRKVKRSCMHHKDQEIEACEKLVDELVDTFIKDGYLNDEAYTAGMVTSLRRAGKSARMIQMKLRSKGLHQEMIQHALVEYDDAQQAITVHPDLTPERQAALTLAKKRRIGPYRKETQKDDENREKRELGALARAGFSYDVCRFILDMDPEEYNLISIF